MTLIFATNNANKAAEIRAALPEGWTIRTLQDAGIDIDIPEPHDTLRENAAEKARTIFRMTGTACFSEDTGLEVPALNNEPGVHSARYAGEARSPQRNMEKLLDRLRGQSDRRARFRTVACLILDDGTEHYFEGICPGTITEAPRGNEGFGYDPVFQPEGAGRTFAEMDLSEKNRYSHRKKAIGMLVTFLNTLGVNRDS